MSFMNSLFASKEKINFKELIRRGAMIIDVRTPAEYQAGHIPDSINIALEQIGATINALKQKKQPLIMVCRSGMRSNAATILLRNAGFEVYNGGPWNDLIKKIK